MPVDTRELRQEHLGKRRCVELAGGEVDEIELLELTICELPEPSCGITLLSTHRTGASEEPGVPTGQRSAK